MNNALYVLIVVLLANLPSVCAQEFSSTTGSYRLDSIDRSNNESVMAAGNLITKATVFLTSGDSTIHLATNIRRDHRIFGYAKPDVHAERLLLLSIFTNDVEHNPFGCKLGAYYDTYSMAGLTLKYVTDTGEFIKARAIDREGQSTVLYLEKKWITVV